jgi:dihydroorotate dehydrogenase
MKRDLYLKSPYLNSAGSLGYDPARYMRQPGALALGAFITNPISLRPRAPAAHPAILDYSGGFLFHNGLPNPGLDSVLKHYTRKWRDSPLPVIVHLMADRPEETARMVRRLETIENVMAIELSFAPGLPADLVRYTLEMALGELPILLNLPTEQILALGPPMLQLGATALSLAAPRGALFQNEELLSGRMFGPGLFPKTLEVVLAATRLGLVVIGATGIYSLENAQDLLRAGALAVQFDSILWNPGFGFSTP